MDDQKYQSNQNNSITEQQQQSVSIKQDNQKESNIISIDQLNQDQQKQINQNNCQSQQKNIKQIIDTSREPTNKFDRTQTQQIESEVQEVKSIYQKKQKTNCLQVIIMIEFLNVPFYALFFLIRYSLISSKNVNIGFIVIMVLTDLISLISFITLIPIVFRKLQNLFVFLMVLMVVNINIELICSLFVYQIYDLQMMTMVMCIHDLFQLLVYIVINNQMKCHSYKQWMRLLKNRKRHKL